MINWTNEQLQGEPVYNIAGSENINGVHFRLANEIISDGTPFSAENMEAIAQKAQMARYFYYGGEDTVTTNFPPADNGLRQGVFLAQTHGGMELAAEGTVYLVADGFTQRIENPGGWPVARDCAVYCQLGEEVTGMIIRGCQDGD